MIDNLTEAIAHCKHRAEENRAEAKKFVYGQNNREACLECASEHEQLASWLEELAERREADRWIPVSERLPEKEGWYLVDRKERTLSIQHFYFDLTDHKPYWSGECKVYYWRPLPEPYKENELKPTKDLINDIVGFDVSGIKPLPEYKESEPKECEGCKTPLCDGCKNERLRP